MSNAKQETIKFSENEVKNVEGVKTQSNGKKQVIDVLIDRCNHLIGSIKGWYATPSEAYSTVVGQPISPKSIVRVNVMTVILIVMVVCAMQNVVVTGATTACVGWLVYHAKKDGKHVAAPKKKGGK